MIIHNPPDLRLYGRVHCNHCGDDCEPRLPTYTTRLQQNLHVSPVSGTHASWDAALLRWDPPCSGTKEEIIWRVRMFVPKHHLSVTYVERQSSMSAQSELRALLRSSWRDSRCMGSDFPERWPKSLSMWRLAKKRPILSLLRGSVL